MDETEKDVDGIDIDDVLKNIMESMGHSHEAKETGIENHCPFCGYVSTKWAVDRFGWPECPNCGAT